MLVFLSWSGQRSKAVAEELERWLGQVIQAVEPWSSTDIKKGLRWGPEISDRLERSKIGIICLTKDNLDARWILFEAGAISKTKDAHVCTLLLDVKPADVEPPLAQFQATTTDRQDIYQLITTINSIVQRSGERPLAPELLGQVFDLNWPRLKNAFQEAVAQQEPETSPARSDSEMLQEVLDLLRNVERRQSRTEERDDLRRSQVDLQRLPLPLPENLGVNWETLRRYNEIYEGLQAKELGRSRDAAVPDKASLSEKDP